MILQALTRYYEDLLSRGEIAAPGWAPAKISLALYINENGELTQIVPTMVEGTKGKKTVMQPQLMVLPAAVKRTISIASNFLWDNSAYLLGIDQKGKPERSRECFAVAAKLHHAVLDIVYDSTNERDFATDLDTNADVAVYVKLPDSFYIATPVGHYNPDWAIAFYEGTVKHIYFVAETKGSMSSMQLRLIEESKIHCAREHFKAISNGNVVYDVVDSYQTLLEKVMR